jgi:hypothetical protein
MKRAHAVLPDTSPIKMTLLNQVLWILQLLEEGAAGEEVVARFGDAEKADALLSFMKETGLTIQSKEAGSGAVISPAGRELLASHGLL